MSILQLQGESENKKIGMLTSIILHLLLLLLLFPNFFKAGEELAGRQGVYIQFGSVDIGGEDILEESQMGQEEISEKESTEIKEEEVISVEEEASPPDIQSEEVARDDESPVVVNDEKTEEEKKKSDAERKAEEEARQKAEEEARRQKELEERKKKFGDIFSKGNSGGDNSGSTGDPEGNPDSGALDEIAKGSGRIGGGLTNRGVLYEPTLSDKSQKSGTVVIEICVNTAGEVISARFTQRGSTTTDKTLVDIATAGAKKYKFTSAEIEKQCGTVTVNFIVK